MDNEFKVQYAFSRSSKALDGPRISQSNCEFVLVREPNSENCLDLIFAALWESFIVLDTNYVTSAIRKFMLDMPRPGSFQNIGINMSTAGLRAFEIMWFKLGKN